MIEYVWEVLKVYFKNMRAPKLEELNVPESLKTQKWSCFVTLYVKWEVRGSAGNIKEIHDSLPSELLDNTVSALTWDKRFSPLTLDESENIGIRVDYISERNIISENDMKKLDPVKNGVIAIHRNYEKLAVILPNMSPKLLTGDDFIPVLLAKLEEKKFSDKEYIIYSIETKSETNY